MELMAVLNECMSLPHRDKPGIFIKGKGGSYLANPAASNAFAFLNVP